MLSRITLTLALGMASLWGAPNLVNGIAFYVNNQPATLLELYKTAQGAGVSKEQAMEILIDKKLHQSEIERFKLSASETEIDQELERIAKERGASVAELREFLAQKGLEWNLYKEEIKERLLERKLYEKIVSNQLRMADERELVAYYEANKNLFSIHAKINAIKYSAKNPEVLQALMKNRLQTPKGVTSEPETILTAKINPRLAALLEGTPDNHFTQVFTLGEDHLTFLITSRENPTLIPFENAKEAVFQRLMSEREDRIIKEHFEKARANAKVKLLRLD